MHTGQYKEKTPVRS